MDYEFIIGGIVIAYPLLTYISRKTTNKIDDKIVKVIDKLFIRGKK